MRAPSRLLADQGPLQLQSKLLPAVRTWQIPGEAGPAEFSSCLLGCGARRIGHRYLSVSGTFGTKLREPSYRALRDSSQAEQGGRVLRPSAVG